MGRLHASQNAAGSHGNNNPLLALLLFSDPYSLSLGFLLNRKPDGFFLNESCLELNCGWKKLYPKGIIIGKVLLRIVFIAVIL